MKVSFICPTKFIEEFGIQSDFILALSHLIDLDIVNEYEQTILDAELPVMCDNGLFENHIPEEARSLLTKAQKINSTYVFAPDVLYNPEKTDEQLYEFYKLKCMHAPKLKVGGVVQANNSEDYLRQLRQFNYSPSCDLIGLSILSIPKSFEKEVGEYSITKSRLYLLKEMVRINKEEGIHWKPMHLLGIGDSYEDVLYAKENCPWIISNDSSCAFQSGLNLKKLNEKLEVPGGKIKEKVDFNLQEVTQEQKECIQFNIDLIKNICK